MSTLTLTRADFSKLAKIDTTGMSHTQKLDAFAKAIGHESQTALMGGLKIRTKKAERSLPNAPSAMIGAEQSVPGDDRLAKAAQALLGKRKSIMADIASGHAARGAAASGWMREDDRDFLDDLETIFKDLEAALAPAPQKQAVIDSKEERFTELFSALRDEGGSPITKDHYLALNFEISHAHEREIFFHEHIRNRIFWRVRDTDLDPAPKEVFDQEIRDGDTNFRAFDAWRAHHLEDLGMEAFDEILGPEWAAAFDLYAAEERRLPRGVVRAKEALREQGKSLWNDIEAFLDERLAAGDTLGM